jgi:hypothetical protein
MAEKWSDCGYTEPKALPSEHPSASPGDILTAAKKKKIENAPEARLEQRKQSNVNRRDN